MKELAKQYDPSQVEDRIYQFWLDGGYFHTKADPDKKPYTIVMPPPNVTGQLHMGHAVDSGCRAMPPCGCLAQTTLPSLRRPRSWRPCALRA